MSTNLDKLMVGICGVGFVGTAIRDVFIKKGFVLDKDLFAYDKYKNISNKYLLLQCKLLFLCLPTKYDNKNEEYDKSSINKVCNFLQKMNYDGLVIIKSTVEPTTTNRLANHYKLNFIHNPEFLTTQSPFKDFMHQKQIIIGVTKNYSIDSFYVEQVQILRTFYHKYFDAQITICLSDESESMKIMENVFGACKVQIFNEFYDLTQKLGINYNKVLDLMLKNNRISPHHTSVPGPDGELSFGGACFTKDINALNMFMKKCNTKRAVIDATIMERNKMRKDNENIV